MAKLKVKVKKLKQPLWQDLVYMALIMVAPIVITCIELFQSHSSIFKISFASIGALFVTYIIIKKYVLNERINKIKQEISRLEHDYSIATGDDNLIKAKWKSCQLKVYLYNTVVILFAAILLYLFISALSEGLIAFRTASMLILLFVVLGMCFKACTFLGSVYIDLEEDNNETK